MPCIIKKYEVSVTGYGSATLYAKNKNQARMRAFHSLQSANEPSPSSASCRSLAPLNKSTCRTALERQF